MRKEGEEKGARGARTAPSVDGVVFISFVAMLMFFFRTERFITFPFRLPGGRISFSKTGKF
jgi:hypothetical protein